MKQKISVTLDDEVLQKLRELARREDSSVSRTINRMIKNRFQTLERRELERKRLS